MNVQELFARLLRFVIIVLATSRLAAAGTIDPDTPDARYLEFGQKFHNVLRLVATVNCDNPKCELKQHPQSGSCVVIAPHWVLTAAHVVENTIDQKVLKDDGTEYKLAAVIPHRSYEAGRVGWHDLALCYSPENFQLEFYPELYTEQDELGKGITIAGYGIHGTFATGGKEGSDGKRRAGQNLIDGAADAVLFCKPKAGSKRMPLEFLIAPGDSGGGMFIGNKLAGINSFLMHDDGKADGNYGDEAAFTRLSLYADWVAAQIELYELSLAARATTGGELPAEPAAP